MCIRDRIGAVGRDDILGRSDFDFLNEEDAAKYAADDQWIIKTGKGIKLQEELNSRATGQLEVLSTTKFPTSSSTGEIDGVMGFFSEITEPLRVAEKLRRTEQRYMLASRASRDGVWEVDLLTNKIHMSLRARELLGVREDREEITWEEFEEALAPGEQELVRNAAEATYSQPGVTVSHVVRFEVDGVQRFVELVGSAMVDDGEVVGLVGTAADVTDERLREEALIYQAGHDDLTGLKNRRSLTRRIARCIHEQSSGGLLYLDLDSFRAVNDSLGHDFGDKVLEGIAQRLEAIAPPTSIVARLGADEFAVLLVDVDPGQSEETATTIIKEIARPFEFDGVEIYLTTSIGIAHIDDQSTFAEEVVRDADIALNNAKDAGKACARVFDERMRQAADDELQLHLSLIHI